MQIEKWLDVRKADSYSHKRNWNLIIVRWRVGMRINKHVSYFTKMIWAFRNSESRSWHNNFFWGVHSPTAPEICTYLVSLYNLLLIGSDGFELYKYRNLSKARERDCAVLWNCQLSSGYEDFRFSNTCTM